MSRRHPKPPIRVRSLLFLSFPFSLSLAKLKLPPPPFMWHQTIFILKSYFLPPQGRIPSLCISNIIAGFCFLLLCLEIWWGARKKAWIQPPLNLFIINQNWQITKRVGIKVLNSQHTSLLPRD
jgi:hypothetical protein